MEPGRELITSTRSERNTASAIECVMNSTLVSVSIQMRCSSMFIRSRVISSSAPNGSSISSSEGSNDSALAIETRCCMPPESCHTACLENPCRPTSSSIRRTRRLRSAASKPITSKGSWTLRETDRHSYSTGVWKTTPRSRFSLAWRAVLPLTLTLPSDGSMRSATMRSRVDLPHPEGPTIDRNSPARMSRSTPRSATVRPSPLPNHLPTPRSSRAGASSRTAAPFRIIASAHWEGRLALPDRRPRFNSLKASSTMRKSRQDRRTGEGRAMGSSGASTIVIENGLVIPSPGDGRLLEGAPVAIRGERIIAVGEAAAAGMTAADAYWGAANTFLEMLRNGITTVQVMTSISAVEDSEVQAAVDSGIRARLIPHVARREGVEATIERIEAEMTAHADRVQTWFGLEVPEIADEPTLRLVAEASQRLGAGVHTHFAEFAPGDLVRLGDAGLLRKGLSLAHCVHLSDGDVAGLAAGGVSVSPNPRSNSRYGNGVAS